MSYYNEIPCDGEMIDPPHPGEVLHGLYMEPLGLSIKEVAAHLQVDRKTVSRLIHGHTAVTAEMALRLGKAFNTTPGLWMNMQGGYDLWHTKQEMGEIVNGIEPFIYESNEDRAEAE